MDEKNGPGKSPAAATSHPRPRLSPAKATALQSLVDQAVAGNGGFGGALLRIESLDGQLVWEGASGKVDARGSDRITPSDAFEIASVTKSFTAVSVLMLVESGAFSLDAPIGTLLPPVVVRDLLIVAGHDYGSQITVRQLLGHTSGLPDYWTDPPLSSNGENAFVRAFLVDPQRLWRPSEIVGYVRALTPFDVPGARYHYSDSGYVLLGMILEQATHEAFHEVVRKRILDPLGMSETFLSYREAPRGAHELAHRYEGALDLHGQMRQSADWAGGGFVSTARDLSRFARALARGELLRSTSSRDAMMQWRETGMPDVDYGLGLFRIALGEGKGHVWGHDGHGNTFMFVWPERRLVCVGTLNQEQADWWPLASRALETVEADAR